MEIIIGKEYPKRVIPLVYEAKHSIDVIVYHWLWYSSDIGSQIQKFNAAIASRSRTGKRVRVITNTNHTIIILKKLGIGAKKIRSSRLVHAKVLILDNKRAVIGSHNYTKNAFALNHEVSILITDRKEIEKLSNFFAALWSR